MTARRTRTARRRSARKANRPRLDSLAHAAHRHTDAGPDEIVCLLCGETYRAITCTHLRAVHGFEGEHPVRDYKERFGLAVASCEEVCEQARKTQIRRHRRAGRHWTKTRLLGEIRSRRRSGRSLAHSRVPVALSLAARRMFGTWDEALRRAGCDPGAHRLTQVWSREKLVQEILQIHARGNPLSTLRIHSDHKTLYRAAIRLVGSWGAALRAAGLDPRKHREPSTWSMDRATAWVRESHAAGRDIRSSVVFPGLVAHVAKATGGTWSAFVESLGIPYPGHRKRLNWTDEAVLVEIRDRKRRGQPLNVKAVRRERREALAQQARKRFGSWDAALRAAGLDPAGIRLTRPRAHAPDPARVPDPGR